MTLNMNSNNHTVTLSAPKATRFFFKYQIRINCKFPSVSSFWHTKELNSVIVTFQISDIQSNIYKDEPPPSSSYVAGPQHLDNRIDNQNFSELSDVEPTSSLLHVTDFVFGKCRTSFSCLCVVSFALFRHSWSAMTSDVAGIVVYCNTLCHFSHLVCACMHTFVFLHLARVSLSTNWSSVHVSSLLSRPETRKQTWRVSVRSTSGLPSPILMVSWTSAAHLVTLTPCLLIGRLSQARPDTRDR